MTDQLDQPDQLTAAQVSAVLDLAAAAAAADGTAPLSEHGILRVRHSAPGQGHDVLVTADGEMAGRRRGLGSRVDDQ